MTGWGAPGTRWVLHTASGTRHLFAFGEGTTYVRVPDAARTIDVVGDDEHYYEALRLDGQTVPVLNDPLPVPVERRPYLLMIGVEETPEGWLGTMRVTTPVVEIELLSACAMPSQYDKKLHTGGEARTDG